MDPASSLVSSTVPATAAQPAAPRPTTGTDVIPGPPSHAGQAGAAQAQTEATAPRSLVADHDYPNVPDTVAGQQGELSASAPGDLE